MADDPYAGLGVAAPSVDPYAGLGVGVAPPKPPAPSVGREAGIAGRSLGEGVGDLADIPAKLGHALTDIPSWASWKVINQLRQAFGKEPLGDSPLIHSPASEFTGGNPTGASVADLGADKLGLPTAQTPVERVGAAAVRALPSAALTPEAPVSSLLASGVSGAASQSAAELGAGPGVQTAAGIAGGLGTAAGPALLRKGAQAALSIDPATAQANIANAEHLGVQPTVGMAAGPGSNAQVVEKGLSMVPGAAGVMRGSIEQANAAAGHTVQAVTDNLGGNIGPQAVGAVVQNGLERQAVPNINATVDRAFKARAAAVPPDTTVDVTAFMKRVDDLAEKDADFAHYVQSSPTFMRLRERAQVGNGLPPGYQTAQVGGRTLYIDPKGNYSPTPPQGLTQPAMTVPFADADSAQRGLNQAIDFSFQAGNTTSAVNGALAQSSKALNSDIGNTLKTIPGAATLDRRANSILTQASEAKGNIRAVLSAKTPEKAANALLAGAKDGDSILDASMRGLSAPDQNVVAGFVINRLGRAAPGVQSADGDVWSPNTFLTNWNKLSANSRDTLFRNAPTTVRENLDQFAQYAENVKRSQAIYANPSGTASAGALVSAGSAVGAAGGAIASGHPVVAASIVAPIVLAYGSAKLMTNPGVVRWLAASTKLPVSAVPVIATQLSQLGQKLQDPEISGLSKALQAQYAAQNGPQNQSPQQNPQPQQ